MPVQLRRLIPIFLIFILLFLLIRHFLIPESFGEYGHYRGNTLEDVASQEMIHASKETCYDCHDDIQAMVANDLHAGLSCLICHGTGLKHAEDPSVDNIQKHGGREFCGRCHQINAARPVGIISQIDLATHNPEFNDCSECHNPHDVWAILE